MSVSTSGADDGRQRMSLREQVEKLLPAWQSWYPSLFHAAEDLGLIRARVCAPSSLMLSHRHASIQNEALQAFKEQWCVEDEPDLPLPLPGKLRGHGSLSNRRDTGSHFKAAPGRPGERNRKPNRW